MTIEQTFTTNNHLLIENLAPPDKFVSVLLHYLKDLATGINIVSLNSNEVCIQLAQNNTEPN